MWTKQYMGYAIHGYFTTDAVRVMQPDKSYMGHYSTLANAKRAIRRRITKDRELLASLGK